MSLMLETVRGSKLDRSACSATRAPTTMLALGTLIAASIQPAYADNRDAFPAIFTISPTGVNIQTGRFTYSKTEFSIGPLSFVRSKGLSPSFIVGKSGGAEQPFGYWQHNFGNGIYWDTSTSSTYAWVIIDGEHLQFVFPSSGGNIPWNTAAANGWKLEPVSGGYRVTNKSGDTFNFVTHASFPNQFPDKNQILASAQYADGHRLDYSYNANGQPRTVLSNRGYAVVMDYNGNGLLTAACGYNRAVTYVDLSTSCAGATLKTGYQYTLISSGKYKLTGVTDVGGSVTTIVYASGIQQCHTYPVNTYCPLINSISLPGGAGTEIQNFNGAQPGEDQALTLPDQVRRQVTATGQIWRYHYFNNYSDVPLQPGEERATQGTMIDPDEQMTTAAYRNGVLHAITAPTGTSYYEFNGLVPLQVTYPEGNFERYWRDGAGNLTEKKLVAKPGSGLSNIVVQQVFLHQYYWANPTLCDGPNVLCDKPVYRIDERGNQTDFTHDPSHGGVLTETGPAVNGVRPQTRYTYAQRHAWIKDSGGGYVQAPTPVWVLTSKSFCKTTAASGAGCAGGASDEVRTLYDYGPDSGPNNLLLRGTVEDSTGAALRSCVTYDWQGNKISETRPKAGLTSCS